MNYDVCYECQYCDISRKNDLGEVRCVKFSTFVKGIECCQFHSSRGLLNVTKELRKGGVNYDR